jgi:MtN3 and saliva related transmembrane protein
MRPALANAVGVVSAVVLLVTIVAQVVRQVRTAPGQGVSPYLFGGQLFASLGFTTYSVMLRDPIFIATNATLAVAALIGIGVSIATASRS